METIQGQEATVFGRPVLVWDLELRVERGVLFAVDENSQRPADLVLVSDKVVKWLRRLAKEPSIATEEKNKRYSARLADQLSVEWREVTDVSQQMQEMANTIEQLNESLERGASVLNDTTKQLSEAAEELEQKDMLIKNSERRIKAIERQLGRVERQEKALQAEIEDLRQLVHAPLDAE